MPGPPKALVVTAGLLQADRIGRLGVRACPLVPIANRPLVVHLLDALRSAGVREAAILGDGAVRAEVADVLGAGTDGLALRYVDRVDDRALDTAALVVQPADAMLGAPLDGSLREVEANRLDGAVLRLGSPAGAARAGGGRGPGGPPAPPAPGHPRPLPAAVAA